VTGQTPGEPNAYERGVKAGKIDEELANHGRRLDKINGSMEKVAERLGSIDHRAAGMEMALQRLEDQMVAAKATVEATAKALREADDARRKADETKRATAEQRWTPVQRTVAVLTVVLVAAGVIVSILALT
jgi:septal ring factor EnvC (AmiA/AmiB activator)